MTPFVLTLMLIQAGGVPSQPQGTAEIHGRVIDAETGRPLAGAVVRLAMDGGGSSLTTNSDSDGRYHLVSLRPGAYRGFVEAGRYRGRYLMNTLRTPNNQTRIAIEAGTILRDVDVKLERARAIEARVVNEWGEPLSGLRIRVIDAGTRREVNFGLGRTDDRGRLRLYGLARGTYILCADRSFTPGGFDGIDQRTRERFLTTCHPSSPSTDGATAVKLGNADVEGVEIRMRRGRTFRVAGTVLDSSGAPAVGAWVMWNKIEANGSSGISVQLQPDGRFVLENVVPGTYAIAAESGGPNRPEQRAPHQVAYVPVTVSEGDVDDVMVAMSPAVSVVGRFTREDPSTPFPKTMAPLLVSAKLATDRGYESTITGGSSDTVAVDSSFRLSAVSGKRVVDVGNVPAGWFVKAVMYLGRDIADMPTEFKSTDESASLEIVLSTRGAVVTGRVFDDRGNPVSRAQIVIAPADRSGWGSYAISSAVRSGANGAYRIGPRRPGEYVVLALGPGVEIIGPDREQLERFATLGERVTLAGDGEIAVDLQLITGR